MAMAPTPVAYWDLAAETSVAIRRPRFRTGAAALPVAAPPIRCAPSRACTFAAGAKPADTIRRLAEARAAIPIKHVIV